MLAASIACLVGGPLLGTLVARVAAPGSDTAQWLSPLALALAFVAGLLLWFGVGVVSVVGGAVWRLLTGRFRASAPDPSRELVPPGYGAFLPLSVGSGVLAGLVAAWTCDASPGWIVAASHIAAGAAYGLSVRALAHHGYLPFPEPE